MKITDVKTFVVGNPPPGIGGQVFHLRQAHHRWRRGRIWRGLQRDLRAACDRENDRGLAERYLVGRDPHDIETFFRRAYSSGFTQRPDISVMGCFSALEMACWDIIGKEADKPVYKLLGGQVHETLRTYTYLYPHTGSVHSGGARQPEERLQRPRPGGRMRARLMSSRASML